MCRPMSLLALAILAGGVQAANEHAPLQIGRSADAQEISNRDLTVLPDGTGLPVGSGTAKEGAIIYAAQCASCHGDKAEGRADFPALAGGRGSLGTSSPVLTVGSYWPYATTLFDYIRRAMPYQLPGALSNDQVYALTAWILAENGIIRRSAVIDRNSLAKVRMPNRDGFVADPRPDIPAPNR